MQKKTAAAMLVLAAGALLAEAPYPMPDGAVSYWEFFSDTLITPGRGFVGKLELGDPVSDMYSAVGGGVERMDYPFWYFFEDGPYALTVIARYDTATTTFPIVGLAVSALARCGQRLRPSSPRRPGGGGGIPRAGADPLSGQPLPRLDRFGYRGGATPCSLGNELRQRRARAAAGGEAGQGHPDRLPARGVVVDRRGRRDRLLRRPR